MIELLGGSRDGHVMARAIAWIMWLIPVAILGWLTFVHRRLDLGIALVFSIFCTIFVALCLMTGHGSYDILPPPNEGVGSSNGVYSWIRTDGSRLFLPVIYYILLTIALIYLTAFGLKERTYWILIGVTVLAYAISAIFIPQITRQPLATLGSLSTMVMLGVGVFAVLLVPG